MPRAKILIIDDDLVCIGLLLAILGDDYQITTVNSGSVGTEVLTLLTPDLILLGITMPEVNGYQVLKFLKQGPRRSRIPVVIISTLNR